MEGRGDEGVVDDDEFNQRISGSGRRCDMLSGCGCGCVCVVAVTCARCTCIGSGVDSEYGCVSNTCAGCTCICTKVPPHASEDQQKLQMSVQVCVQVHV